MGTLSKQLGMQIRLRSECHPVPWDLHIWSTRKPSKSQFLYPNLDRKSSSTAPPVPFTLLRSMPICFASPRTLAAQRSNSYFDSISLCLHISCIVYISLHHMFTYVCFLSYFFVRSASFDIFFRSLESLEQEIVFNSAFKAGTTLVIPKRENKRRVR